MENQNQNSNYQKKSKLNYSPEFLINGKLPPQVVELEEAVLGALMLEKEAINDTIDILSKDAFYKESHQKIFEAIKDLFQDSEPVDILTVTERLKKKGDLDAVGGPYFISQLTGKIASSANVEYHARIITQKFIQRELIRISSETINKAYDETKDVFELLDFAESSLYKVTEGNIKKSFDSMDKLLVKAIKQIEELAKQQDGIRGVPSGFSNLDRVTSGFQKSDLVILAARPGMGKTAFVLSLARNSAVDFNKPVAVFSLEMSSVQLFNRLIASETEISAEKLKRGNLAEHEWHQLHTKINKLSNAPIFIDDTPGLSIFELRAKARRLKQKHDIQMIIIDYLQLMTAGGDAKGNREQEISTISRSIKNIAKELDVPIIALSQLSRSVETRGGTKRPQLSDLRESGAIEQDADMVMFIYRPEYYKIHEKEDGTPYADGESELIIAKHRNGALEDVPVRFIPNLAKFVNLDIDEASFLEPITPNEDFGNPNAIIRGSKMNDLDEEQTPF
jgi:replicative DNA helicase